jgi:hypothetical protein
VLEYNTGAPTSLLEETCPNESEPRRVEDLWYLEYYQFHREGAEINSYEQGGWKVSGKGDPWATTQTSGGDHGVTESTKFTLRHTPK